MSTAQLNKLLSQPTLRRSFNHSQEQLAELLGLTPQVISKCHALSGTAMLHVLVLDFAFGEDFILYSSPQTKGGLSAMSDLIKIRDVSDMYDITARTLRYYEDMGLITSSRSNDYAYRLYDKGAIQRLEQILILRKLNVSIKDIQRIFNDAGSSVVLDVLGKKAQSIDDEVALLNELKDIVLDFIGEIERMNFINNSDIKRLYNKAKDIESHLVSVDYIGKPNASKVERLVEITEKLDKKIPDVMIVRIPSFRAITGDFGELMGWAWSEGRREMLFKDVIFDCPDFAIRYDDRFEYTMAVRDEITDKDTAPYKIHIFEGGLYAVAVSINDDHESIGKVEFKICERLENSTNFVYDDSRGVMGSMPYLNETDDDEIKKGLGYFQLYRFVPIKLEEDVSA